MRHSSRFSKTEYISGVDVIMHVASPLPNAASPQVILEVRIGNTHVRILPFSDCPKIQL